MAFYGSVNRNSDQEFMINNDDIAIDQRSPQLQRQREQNFLLIINQEIKKSVNESLEGVIVDLRKQVTDLQSEVASLQQSSTGGRSGIKRPRLPKLLTVRVYNMDAPNIPCIILYRQLLRNFMKLQKINLIQANCKITSTIIDYIFCVACCIACVLWGF